MTNNDLTCQELVELVTDYLEDKLDAADKTRFESHLMICEGCRTYLTQIQQTIQLMGKVTEDEIPEEAKDHLLDVFKKWKTN